MPIDKRRAFDSPRSRPSQTAPPSESETHRVWAEALARPSFRKALDDGLADIAAGRTKAWAEVRKRLTSK